MINEIVTIDDVKMFFQLLLAEDLNFHPDTLFEDYIHCETKQPTYSVAEAGIRNQLMEQCFDICDAVNTDIYEIANEIFPPFPWPM